MTILVDIAQLRENPAAFLAAKQGPDWLAEQRQIMLDAFCRSPLPTRKTEHFKYNDMTFLGQQSIGELPHSVDIQKLDSIDADITIEQVNGRWVATQSEGLKGISISHYAEAPCEETVQSFYQKLQGSPNSLLKLAAGLIDDGLFVDIDSHFSGVIHVRHALAGEQGLANSQLTLRLASGASATLIESYESAASDSVLQLQQTFVCLQPNAELDYYQYATHALPHRLIAGVDVHLHRDSRFSGFCFNPGGKLNRFDINLRHLEENAQVNLNGVYLPRHSACVDFHTNIEHRAAHCQSDEVFRGIVDDEASATFNGKIHIFPGAQKSDAYMNNKNLLLTNRAEVNTKPELEIYADDVKCAHGATVAQLDNKAVYFMQSRGIDKTTARKMLSIGFVKALLENIKHQPLRELLTRIVNERLS